jgi:hypothetical protein
MAGFIIRPYRETDRAAVIAAEIDLQEYERTLHDTRLPGGPDGVGKCTFTITPWCPTTPSGRSICWRS